MKYRLFPITAACLFLALVLFALPARAQLSKAEYYNRIDNQVYLYSKKSRPDFDSVLAFVNGHFSKTEDRVRAYYTWIAMNVAYDMSRINDLNTYKLYNMRNESEFTQNADTVFNRRKAVCEGFSKLMNKFCQASGIESQMVCGYTKMPESDEVSTDLMHAWNAVKLDTAWCLLDITWSNGYVDYNKGYVKRFSDKYFLAKPSDMVKDHWPLDPMWQLQNQPVTRREFFNQGKDTVKLTFNYNDSIAHYLKLNPEQRFYADFQHYLREEPGNTNYQTNLDVWVSNTSGEQAMVSGMYYDDYVDFFNNTLIRKPSLANCKKARELLAQADTHTKRAREVLQGKTAYTLVYKEKFKALDEHIGMQEKDIAEQYANLAKMQKMLGKK